MNDLHHEYLILGAGPAGLQIAHDFEKQGRDYLILEGKDYPGAFFDTFPRHRKLISINKVNTGSDDAEFNLRFDWNSILGDEDGPQFGDYSERYFADPNYLVQYLRDYAEHYNLRVQTGTRIETISRNGEGFALEDTEGNRYTCDRLIMATGVSKPFIPNIPGIEAADNYFDCEVDPEDYKNQRVLILGKGNSAFEMADSLIEHAAVVHVCSPKPVTLAWESHFVGHVRAVNVNFLDTYQLKAQNAVIDADVKSLEHLEDGKYAVNIVFSHAMGQTRRIVYDRVVVATGFRFDNSLFEEECRPAMTDCTKLPLQTSAWESTNVPNLFFAGTITQMRDYRKTMSGFIHGFRYNARCLTHILGQRFHENAWPSEEFSLTTENLLSHLVDRISRSSGMFLQPGFLCDLMVVDEDKGTVRLYADVPRDYVHDGGLGEHEHSYTVSLEYGVFDGKPLAMDRDPSPDQAHRAPYLHPIIRRFENGKQVAEHHIHDDLENEWHRDEFVEPTRAFFQEQLAEPAMA